MLINDPVLLLNASYEPLTITRVRRALVLMSKGKALVEVPTKRLVYPGVFAPSVIRLVDFHRVPRLSRLQTRKNLYVRDSYRCMYCGRKKRPQDLTLDHVIPRSQGGLTDWDNLVAACKPCNHRKANRTPDEANMPLLRRPLPMTIHSPRFILRSLGAEVKEWEPFLWMDSRGIGVQVGQA